MAELRMALLGPPDIRHGERPLAFPTRKALALLVYLAVEGGLHTREKLAAFFWPDSDQQHSRAMLRYTVASLRRLLDHLNGPVHLVAERDTLSFGLTADVEIDLHAVQAAQALARTAALGSTTELQRATRLYRGEFHEGFSLPGVPDFDDWVSLQREIWHQKIEYVFDRLSRLETDRGEPVAALETVSRWLAVSPLNEEVHRRLMRLHLAAGDRSAALRAFEVCRSLLERGLEVAPSPETEALVEHIRFGMEAVPHDVAQDVAATLPPTRLLDGPLVGRQSEFTKLVELYHSSRQRRAQVATLQGEPGIGKTRLAREFLGWAAGHGAEILQGAAFETGGRLPYQPLVDALRPRLEQENAPEDLLSDVWLVELSRILPELRDRYPDLPVPAGDESAARTRLFEAVVRLGQALASRAPVVLFVDDVQWSDAGSLDVLHYAARRWAEENTPLLMLLNLRDEAVTTPSLSDWLAGLRRNLPVTPMELGPLTLEDTRQFVAGLVALAEEPKESGTQIAELGEFAQWLFAETAGQPLFVVESIRELLERGAISPRKRTNGGWGIELQAGAANPAALAGILPPGVRAVIDARLARLAPPARRVLEAGATLGQGFAFDSLCRLTGLSEDEGLLALDEVLDAHLLQETAGDATRSASGAYCFTHDRIRDVVYDEAGDARRGIYHRRALEMLMGAAPSSQLARHARGAGLEDRAILFDIAAGHEAMELLASRDALVHYERAMRGADRLGWSTTQTDLHAQLGRAFVSLAQWGDARRELEAALAGLAVDQSERRAEILVDLLEVCWWLLDVPGLRQQAKEALDLAVSCSRGDLETAALGWLAAAIGADGDVAQCVADCSRTVERARELALPAPPQVHTYLSLSFYWLGQIKEAIKRSTEGIEESRARHHASATMWCLPHLGIALAANGQYAEALQTFEEARRFGRQYGVSTLLARSIAMSAGFHLDVFDFEGNEALAEEARDLARSLGFSPPVVSAGIDLLLNLARRGEVGPTEKLMSEVAEAVQKASGFHGWLWSLRLAEARAEIALARGDLVEALAWASQAIEHSRGRRRAKYEVISLDTHARALHALGRTNEAIADLRMGITLARTVEDPALLLPVATRLLEIDGDDRLAIEVGDAVRKIAQALPTEQMRHCFEAAPPVRIAAKLSLGY